MHDLNGKILTANTETARLYGVSTIEEFLSEVKTVFDLLTEDGKAFAAANIRKISANGTLQKNEYLVRVQSGAMLTAEANSSVVKALTGEPFAIISVIRDITERKQAEEKLREAHRRLDEIIEFLPDATFVIDADSKVIAWNRAIEQMTGVPKAEMIGKGEYEYALPFYGERRPILIDLALLPDAEFEKGKYDIAQRTADTIYGDVYTPKTYRGKGAYLYAAASRLRDAAGNIVGAIESIRDITEFKQAEEALRESEEKYRTIIENMQEGYHEVDLKGNFTFVNESTCKILGYEREELLGMNNRQYADEENNRKVYQVYNHVYRTGEQVKNFEWQIIRKDGERRDIEVSISPIRDMEGHPTGFRGIVRDTTDRKQAEEALRAERERLISILDGIPVPTFVIDRNRHILLWNSNNEIFTGIAKEEVLGKPLDLSSIFREKVSPTLAELIMEMGDEELIAKFGRRGLRKSEVQPHAFESTGRIWIRGGERIVNRTGREDY